MNNNIVKIRLRSWTDEYYMLAKEIKYINHRGIEKITYKTVSRHSPGIDVECIGYIFYPVDVVLINSNI